LDDWLFSSITVFWYDFQMPVEHDNILFLPEKFNQSEKALLLLQYQ